MESPNGSRTKFQLLAILIMFVAQQQNPIEIPQAPGASSDCCISLANLCSDEYGAGGLVLRYFFQRAFGALVFGFGLLVEPLTANAIPVLQVNGSGILTGVQDVLVGGSPYNVTFVDGTCAGIFGVCDAAHFAFSSFSAATAAALSLEAAITGSVFASTPDAIQGCIFTSTNCQIWTPYFDGTNLVTRDLIVQTSGSFVLGGGIISAGFDSSAPTAAGNQVTWAVWTSSASSVSVPEPSSSTVLGTGLLALIVFGWRRKEKRTLRASRAGRVAEAIVANDGDVRRKLRPASQTL